MKLSKTERWILSNQFRILAKLYPDEADYFERAQEAMHCGYELEYDWISEHIYQDTMKEEECREVLDIMEMFYQMKYAYEQLADKSGIEEHRIRFTGFDGNNESKQLGCARHFCTGPPPRYEGLARGDNLNSHAPLLPLYRKMLVEYQRAADPHQLTKDDLVRITSVKMI